MLSPHAMSTPASDLLDLSPGEAARRIARNFMNQARAAAVRLDDPEDAESLHDFRVSIRRTRATLRAWRGPMAPEISRKDERDLKRVMGSTGIGRDAEVMLEWVTAQAERLDAVAMPGHRWLCERLARRKANAYDSARGEVRAAFGEVEESLAERLSVMTRQIRLDAPAVTRTYATALADALDRAIATLGKRMRKAHSLADAEQLHTARIDTKRLRYLIEPIKGRVPGAGDLVAQCKQLQDVLGQFQDSSVLEEELVIAMPRAAELRAQRIAEACGVGEAREIADAVVDEAPGLLALLQLNQARAERLFGEVRTHWLGGGLAGLEQAVAAMAERLRAHAAGPVPVEIERKYLLSALPAFAEENGERAEMDQGYLPGERLIERVRRVRTVHGERFVRTVKAGKGIKRIELEEPCDARIFEAMWPLTDGCRVQKVRYAVPDGDRIWEIDAFTDRELFLAEVELPTEDAEVVFPEWLAPLVVREVTDDGSYTNRRLAR